MKKKLLTLLAMAAIGAALVTGCGGGKEVFCALLLPQQLPFQDLTAQILYGAALKGRVYTVGMG